MDPTSAGSSVQIISIVAQWGIAGLFFLMWLFERKDRVAAEKTRNENEMSLKKCVISNGELVKLVQGCTVATTRNTDVIEKLGEGVDRLTVVLNKGG